jgi:hypothetical protein
MAFSPKFFVAFVVVAVLCRGHFVVDADFFEVSLNKITPRADLVLASTTSPHQLHPRDLSPPPPPRLPVVVLDLAGFEAAPAPSCLDPVSLWVYQDMETVLGCIPSLAMFDDIPASTARPASTVIKQPSGKKFKFTSEQHHWCRQDDLAFIWAST